MRFRLPTAVWIAMACVAFVAQVVPRAWGGECDRGCCAAESCCCSACPTAPSAPPCRCQLDARQDQPLAVSNRGTTARDRFEPVAVVESAAPDAPPAAVVSRAHVATLLSVPIRPVRILYGVWRN